jgi:hypothetical protein
VKSDGRYIYYRFQADLQITNNEVYDPSPSTPALVQSVDSGKVFDNPTGALVGTFDLSFLSTSSTRPGGPYSEVMHGLVELGPAGDDSFIFTGGYEFAPGSAVPEDFDVAVTGGTGQFMGAFGQIVTTSSFDATGKGNATVVLIVPKIKKF